MSFDEIRAPAQWRCVDFISDVHLQESEAATFLAWRNYLEHTPADAVFILGDLFELWVGDDVVNPASTHLNFEERCAGVLRDVAKRKKLYFLHGNRDFLMGQKLLHSCGMTLLADPSVLAFGGQRYLLSHGDALCLSDTDYQQFRAKVRSSEWQSNFLATPLPQRLQQALHMRTQSEARKQSQQAALVPWSDVDAGAAQHWMNSTRCMHFIHGHTHEGRDHVINSAQGQGVRHVLPDWHADASPPRGHALRMSLSGDVAPPALVQRVNTV